LNKVVKQLNITDVRIRKVQSEGKMRAVASITFDDEFVVHDVRVIEGQNGLFVAMPSRKTPEGEFRDVAHPITSAARELIQDAVLKAFNDME
jgi:stage V sporulation protein G